MSSMGDVRRRLELSTDIVAEDRDMCLAFALEAENSSDSSSDHAKLIAGSNYRRAGADSLLLNEPSTAKALFAKSTACYLEGGNAYGYLLASLAAQIDYVNVERGKSPNDVFYLVRADTLRRGAYDSDDLAQSIIRFMEPFRGKAVGILGFPAGVLVDLYSSSSALGRHGSEAMIGPLIRLVEVYADALREARRRRHHWRLMTMPFHPLDPDIIAVLRSVKMAFGDSSEALVIALNAGQVDEIAGEILMTALQQFDEDDRALTV